MNRHSLESLPRVDGPLKVSGRAAYVAEIPLPQISYAVMVTSTIAAGRIAAIDTSAAEAAPGVLAVLTHRNFPRLSESPVALKRSSRRAAMRGSAAQQRLPMQDEQVKYAGEPIAAVIAETFEAATAAAALVQAAYEPQPPRLDLDALRSEAIPPENVWGEATDHTRGNLQQGMEQADVWLARTYHTQVQHHVTMEPHSVTAQWQAEEDQPQLTVYLSSSWVYGARMTIAAWFDLPQERVRVANQFVGGTFGSKGPVWPHAAIAIAAARHVKRPVKLMLSRQQTFTDAGYRPQLRHDLQLAATGEGRLTAFAYQTTSATSMFDDRVVAPTTNVAQRLYACPNVELHYRMVLLNRAGPFTMRAPGEAPALFAIESAMDELAYALKIDPLELRLRNYAEEDPEAKQPWSSKHLRQCYLQAAERFGWAHRDPRPCSGVDGDWLIGSGMATAIYHANAIPAMATATLSADDEQIVVRSATCDQGTGSYTIMAQLAAEALGVPAEMVRFELGDTNYPMAPISAGSMTTTSVGTAVSLAAADLRRQLMSLATAATSPLANLREDQITFRDGRLVASNDGATGITLNQLLQQHDRSELVGHGKTEMMGEAQQVSRFAFGSHFVEVRVHRHSGEVRVSRYVAGFAAGRIVNPLLAHSQLIGGIVWGIGQALLEETHTDMSTGRLVNTSLAEYLVPTNPDIAGKIDAFFVPEEDQAVNPIGVKGVGEIGTVGSAAAIANAVYHATGVRVRDLPITPEKLLNAMPGSMPGSA